MLAYLFWHSPAPRTERSVYEDALLSFHEALAEDIPPGFLRSATHRLDGVPWLPGGTPVYEDWYYLDSSAALDPLDDAALDCRRYRAHDAVAVHAGAGAGGLYQCIRRDRLQGPMTVAHWLDKPRGVPYRDFLARLEAALPPGAGLWQRKMVLGPAPELCILAPEGPTFAGATLRLPRLRVTRA